MNQLVMPPTAEYVARYYQDEAAEAPFKFFAENSEGNGLIALPTASGKSVVIPLFLRKCYDRYPLANMRVLIMVPSKDLVRQNAEKMRSILPMIPFGINCDGLKQRDTMQPIIIGTPGSVVSMMEQMGKFDLILVDEAHTIPEKETAVYNRIIIRFKEKNELLRLLGLTATPYDNYGTIIQYDPKTNLCISLFSHMIYDRTKPEDFIEFIHKNWLCSLIGVGTDTKYDISKVGMSGGEFNQSQLQKATDKEEITRRAVAEMIEVGNRRNRHCALVFSNGIDHAEHICEELQLQGETATCIHSKMSDSLRDQRLNDYRAGKYRWMVNNGVLTTGFDHPPIDLICVLRHTCSIPLWVQILGRGLRVYDWLNPAQYIPGFEYTKTETIVMDFADNTGRLGPVDDPIFKKRSKGEGGDAPVKICPVSYCKAYNYASARYCYMCDHEFQFEVKYTAQSSGDSPMSNTEPVRSVVAVGNITYAKLSSGGQNILQVTYHCGPKKYTEIVCIEHKTAAARHAWGWWTTRSEPGALVPSLVDDAMRVAHKLKRPHSITVEVSPGSKYPKVISHEF